MLKINHIISYLKSKYIYVFSCLIGISFIAIYSFIQTNSIPQPSESEQGNFPHIERPLKDVSFEETNVSHVNLNKNHSYPVDISKNTALVPNSLQNKLRTPPNTQIPLDNVWSQIALIRAQERMSHFLSDTQMKMAILEENFIKAFAPMVCPYDPNGRYTIQDGNNGIMILSSSIEVGDSAGSILSEWLTMTEVFMLVKASKNVHPLTSLRVGRAYTVAVDIQTKKVTGFYYEIDDTTLLSIDCTESGNIARKEKIPYELSLTLVNGTIKENFFNAVLHAGENANFAIKLARIFSFDIDFVREIRSGDEFNVLVEKRFRDNKFVGYGRILGAYFKNDGDLFEAFLYHDGEGDFTYYDSKGIALQKAFLKTPLSFTRISSGYSMRRKHPILGITRPHQGIDYAAPMGTPVMSVGDGKISKAAYTGGYGHLIVVQHKGGLVSQYAHLSKYGRGIRRGVKVKQGQIIGYVGSTGLSTGPHLDFRMRRRGKFTNPDSIIVPSKDPVKKNAMDAFREKVILVRSYMTKEKELQAYTSDTWLR